MSSLQIAVTLPAKRNSMAKHNNTGKWGEDLAADYLRENPTATIANVAYKYGFNSPRYFSQCFKKVYGANPTEWREKQ